MDSGVGGTESIDGRLTTGKCTCSSVSESCFTGGTSTILPLSEFSDAASDCERSDCELWRRRDDLCAVADPGVSRSNEGVDA